MKKILLLASIFLATQAEAQKKVTYFENGKKSFEGEYSYGLSTHNIRDNYNFDTAADSRRTSSMNMSFRGMDREAQPQKIYNGKCTFYYDNGKVSYSGEYRHGVKTGTFSYNYYDGSKEAEMNFENGMANGTWQGWYKNGKTRFEQQYVAISEAEIDTMLAKKMRATTPLAGNSVMQSRGNMRNFGNDSLRKLPNGVFSKFTEQENSFFKNAHWNGVFTSNYENGKKCTEMRYSNDVRTGTWKYWSAEGELYVALTFVDGKITEAINQLPADMQQNMSTKTGERPIPGFRDRLSDSARNKMGGNIPNRPDQQPSPSVDARKYIEENLKYPDEAQTKKIMGPVVVKFTVNEDGTTGEHEVMKGLGYGCDEEAVRVIKSMPAWKPAMKDGKPMKGTTTLPVFFRPLPTKK